MKTPEAQREYQRQWLMRRRETWFAENGPCVDCGSWNSLQLDHVDPSQKISHNVWSWSKARRDIELAKCVVRCKTHHDEKSWTERAKGESHGHSKLTTEQVQEVRARVFSGESQASIARSFGLGRWYVNQIVKGRNRKYE